MTSGSDWIGTVGDTWADEWERTDRSFADLSRHLDAAILAAVPNDDVRALDIGCGAGGTSLSLAAARPDARITGIDLSSGLIDVARRRAALIDDSHRPTFQTADAITAARSLAPLDILYSRHGVMFFDDPVAAFTEFHASARPNGSLVFSCFADWVDNAFARAIAVAIGASPPVPAVPGPFAFADPARVATILAAAGWRDAAPVSVPSAYRAGAGDDPVADALSFFQRIGPAAPILRAAPADDRARLLDALADVITEHRIGNVIDFPALAWIWSARA